jgi:hypothetical protein
MFPSHLQISFYADYLEAFASSSEQTMFNSAQFYENIKWEKAELPACFTAINQLELIKEKRLVILIWLASEGYNQEVIG